MIRVNQVDPSTVAAQQRQEARSVARARQAQEGRRRLLHKSLGISISRRDRFDFKVQGTNAALDMARNRVLLHARPRRGGLGDGGHIGQRRTGICNPWAEGALHISDRPAALLCQTAQRTVHPLQ